MVLCLSGTVHSTTSSHGHFYWVMSTKNGSARVMAQAVVNGLWSYSGDSKYPLPIIVQRIVFDVIDKF